MAVSSSAGWAAKERRPGLTFTDDHFFLSSEEALLMPRANSPLLLDTVVERGSTLPDAPRRIRCWLAANRAGAAAFSAP